MGFYAINSTQASQPPTAQGTLLNPLFQTHCTAAGNGSTLPLPQGGGQIVTVDNNVATAVSQGRHQLINYQSNVSHAEHEPRMCRQQETVSTGANVSNTTGISSQAPVILSSKVVGNEGSLVSVCDAASAHVSLMIWKSEYLELARLFCQIKA